MQLIVKPRRKFFLSGTRGVAKGRIRFDKYPARQFGDTWLGSNYCRITEHVALCGIDESTKIINKGQVAKRTTQSEFEHTFRDLFIP